MIVAFHHRQSAYIPVKHFRERGMQRFVRKCDRKISAASLRHGHFFRVILPQGTDNVAARDDADKLVLLIHNQSSLTPVEIGIASGNAIRKF